MDSAVDAQSQLEHTSLLDYNKEPESHNNIKFCRLPVSSLNPYIRTKSSTRRLFLVCDSWRTFFFHSAIDQDFAISFLIM